MQQISIVTGSERKRSEISAVIGTKLPYTFLAYDLDEIQGAPRDIITRKLQDAYELAKGPVVVEDYSLYIDRLAGFPGPYVKSLLKNGELGRIVKELAVVGEVRCSSECLYGYTNKQGETFLFSATAQGVLVPSEREASGLFGVDELLVIDGTDKPYLYLSPEEKDQHSIRKKALEQLMAHIVTEQISTQ
ncbi:inosine triphosphate pyrophosphatase [Nematocida homosporus]|uniref:inosine triphosphate pyrophosphatase n=1 Tax=Nematocida homosporus TaxID=1912981 RepID=UPI0022201B09|nr:inosine triphosphate pyrophosphatase [Nematocida homosporus]KAI5185390.1 inosine triphosphate pyrophosphatase [Nematocida homosporus]